MKNIEMVNVVLSTPLRPQPKDPSPCGRVGEGSVLHTLKKYFTSLFAHYRAENPRIVKDRSSHGISRENE